MDFTPKQRTLSFLPCDKTLKIIRVWLFHNVRKVYLPNTDHPVLFLTGVKWSFAELKRHWKQCECPGIPLQNPFLGFLLIFTTLCLRTFPGKAGRKLCLLGYWLLRLSYVVSPSQPRVLSLNHQCQGCRRGPQGHPSQKHASHRWGPRTLESWLLFKSQWPPMSLCLTILQNACSWTNFATWVSWSPVQCSVCHIVLSHAINCHAFSKLKLTKWGRERESYLNSEGNSACYSTQERIRISCSH